MTGRDWAAEPTALRDLWHRWTAVVEQFARRRRGRRRLREREYQALHQNLLRVCQALAGADEQARPFYEGLETVARPWLSLWVLEQADRQILFDLLDRSRQAGGELGGPTWGYLARAWAGPGLALTAFAVWASLLIWIGSRVFGPLLARVGDGLRVLRWAVNQPVDPWWLGAVLTLIAIWLVVRAARS
jgi:hypothetical protein